MKSIKLIQTGMLLLLLAGILAACAGAGEVINTEYILTAAMREGNFVFLGVDGEINGLVNPALSAKPGERITVMLVNGGEGTHDIVFALPGGKKIKSDAVNKQGETTSITFTVPQQDAAITYYDSAHEKLGMKGVLLVGAAQEAQTAEQPAAQAPQTDKPAGLYDKELAAQAFQKGGCTACHTIPGIPGAGTIGPDLSEIGAQAAARIASGEYSGPAKTAEAVYSRVDCRARRFHLARLPNRAVLQGADAHFAGRGPQR